MFQKLNNLCNFGQYVLELWQTNVSSCVIKLENSPLLLLFSTKINLKNDVMYICTYVHRFFVLEVTFA
jgi:hypothetical protein